MRRAAERCFLVPIDEGNWRGMIYHIYRHFPSCREVHIGKDFDPEYPQELRRMKWFYRIPSLDPDWIPYYGNVDGLKLHIVDDVLGN